MATVIFECLRRADIKINTIKYAFNTGVVVFVDIHSRSSLKTFNKIPGTVNIIESLREFRKKIEEYVYGLQKY